jgi:hypothetical protein
VISGPRQAARQEAVSLLSASRRLEEAMKGGASEPVLHSEEVAAATPAAARPTEKTPGWKTRLSRFLPWVGTGSTAADEILDNGVVRVRLHPETGGILSLRGSDETANRLSQRLTRRITSAAAGSRWQDPLERSEYAAMVADNVRRSEKSPHDTLESSGRLVDSQDKTVGTFSQRITLPDNSAVLWMTIELHLEAPIEGHPLENYAACRFAWNENDAVELFRSIHTQSVASERTIMLGEHFIELGVDDLKRVSAPQRVAIFPLGLPWHVRSHSHMLDTVLLAGGASSGTFQLAIGVGRERPWDDALRLMTAPENVDAEGLLAPLRNPADPNGIRVEGSVRFTAGDLINESERLVGLHCGLLEAAGRRQQARVRMPRQPVAAWRCSADGKRGASLVIEDDAVLVSLAAYEWAFLEIRFVDTATPSPPMVEGNT